MRGLRSGSIKSEAIITFSKNEATMDSLLNIGEKALASIQ